MYRSQIRIEEMQEKAKNLFVNHETFSEEQQLGYYRLMREAYGDKGLNNKTINLQELAKVVESLNPRYQKIITIRYFEGDILERLGEKMGVSRERSRQLKEKCILKIRKYSREFCLEEMVDFNNRRKRLLNQAKRGKISDSDMSIDELRLSRGTRNSLMRNGISTIGKLINCTIEDLTNIRNCGKKVNFETFESLHNFLPKGDELLQLNFSIRVLGILPRYIRCLESVGINTIKQLYEYSKLDIMAIPGMTDLGTEKITKRINEFFPEWENYHATKPKTKETHIFYLDLGTRAYSALCSIGISNLGELINITEEELLNIPNIGEKSVQEILGKIDCYKASI